MIMTTKHWKAHLGLWQLHTKLRVKSFWESRQKLMILTEDVQWANQTKSRLHIAHLKINISRRKHFSIRVSFTWKRKKAIWPNCTNIISTMKQLIKAPRIITSKSQTKNSWAQINTKGKKLGRVEHLMKTSYKIARSLPNSIWNAGLTARIIQLPTCKK